MTIKQLKEAIKDLPDNMDVFMGERLTEFTYGMVNGATVKEIDFYEDMGDEFPMSTDKCLVLEEE